MNIEDDHIDYLCWRTGFPREVIVDAWEKAKIAVSNHPGGLNLNNALSKAKHFLNPNLYPELRKYERKPRFPSHGAMA